MEKIFPTASSLGVGSETFWCFRETKVWLRGSKGYSGDNGRLHIKIASVQHAHTKWKRGNTKQYI